jgi:hypothetical protein
VYSINQQKEFYGEMADSYYQTNPPDIEKAIFFKEHFLQLSKQVSDLREIKTACIHLVKSLRTEGRFPGGHILQQAIRPV